MTATVSEAVARPVRGLGQGGVGWVVVEAIEAFNIYDFTEKQYGLAVVIISALVSFLQNLLENKLGKGLLRKVPPKEVPVVDSTSTGDEGEDEVTETAPQVGD
jgi:hypothetical protein